LDYVLSDIPFFCVGITAFAVLTFFVVMRRIDLPAIFLFSSSLVAFIAAILDLTQILVRGTTNTDQGLALNTVSGLVNTREVGLALSFGFRYLYLWAFVAQRPRYEPRPRTNDDPLYSDSHYHSANWERWGLFGLILKYALLGAVLAIPILQIVWRIAVTGLNPVYVAESTIQIAVSVLLIAKLMLNLYLSTVAPWWRPFTPYIVPIIALMISTGIGTGNLLHLKFSETTLGRFLQAVELYALMLSLLIFTFYNVPKYAPSNAGIPQRKARSSFFTGLPDFKSEEGQFQVQVSAAPPRVQILEEKQRPTMDPQDMIPPTPNTFLEIPTTPSTSRPFTGVSFASYYGMAASNSRLTMPAVIADSEETRNTESPIYGLNGILASTTAAPESPTLARRPPSQATMLSVRQDLADNNNRESVNSFDELLRQQTELDKSIAALRLFSPTMTSMSASSLPIPPDPEPTADSRESRFGGGDRTLSISSGTNRSEFSLSIFPEPPPVDEGVVRGSPLLLPESILPPALALGGRARDPPFPAGRRRQSRVPRSALSNLDSADVEGVRASEGTQYDVTSFIGGESLTCPNEQKISVLGGVAEKPESDDDDVESSSPALTSSGTTAPLSLRPLFLSSLSPAITSLPPATASSGLLTSSPTASNNNNNTTYEYPVLKPLLLGGTAPSPLSAGARRTPGNGSTTFGGGGPRRPTLRGGQGRPVISGPRPKEEDLQGGGDEEFERPRRPPAVGSQQDDAGR
ncbi:hypothetical protein C8R46DRAFT_896268, partial [Mycena filopes]